MDPCSPVKRSYRLQVSNVSCPNQCMSSVLTFLYKPAGDCGRGLQGFAFLVCGNGQWLLDRRTPLSSPHPSPLWLCSLLWAKHFCCLLSIFSWDSTISGPSACNMPSVTSVNSIRAVRSDLQGKLFSTGSICIQWLMLICPLNTSTFCILNKAIAVELLPVTQWDSQCQHRTYLLFLKMASLFPKEDSHVGWREGHWLYLVFGGGETKACCVSLLVKLLMDRSALRGQCWTVNGLSTKVKLDWDT